ncbi:MAG: malonyl-ACP O-methyltransferase BioC [Gammaproteobacteria bacterium]|nr:malonyl-ACP O-methyltransferase BioC [Gammaproteobacteria bacterium]
MTDIDKKWIRNSFDHAANHYDAAAVLQREVADRLDERLDVILYEPKVILDIGSGTGYSADLLRKRYPKARVIELDIAHSMLKISRHKKSWLKRWRGNYQYLCADAEALPLADQSVDMVFSSLAFQWCRSFGGLFEEIRRVLTPTGLLMFAYLGPDTLKELRLSWAAVDKTRHVVEFVDMHDVGDDLLRAQMVNPVMDMEYLTLTYGDVRELMQDLKRLGSRNAMSGRQKGLTGKRKLSGMIQAYEQYRRNNVIPATYEVVYGHAWAPERVFDNTKNDFPIPVKLTTK